MSNEPVKKKTVGVVAPGRMGAAIAQRMSESQVFESILTVTQGRSENTIERARNASLISSPSLRDLVNSVDIFISTVPPSEAVSLATEVVSLAASRKNTSPVFTFIDSNATSPETARQIAKLFEGNDSLVFIDGSIIGIPPYGDHSPTIYLSGKGTNAQSLADALQGCGVIVKAVQGGIGAASALKMSHAMLTKGTIALAATSVLGAAQNDVLPDLINELSISQPSFLATISSAAEVLPFKSYRFIGEMLEIASYLRKAGLSQGEDVYKGIAGVYERANSQKEEDARTLEHAAKLVKEQSERK